MKALKFVKSVAPYVKGDIAGFDAETADKYVKNGFAVAFKKEKEVSKDKEDKQVKNEDKKTEKVVTK